MVPLWHRIVNPVSARQLAGWWVVMLDNRIKTAVLLGI
jgi:hypothetical protein